MKRKTKKEDEEMITLLMIWYALQNPMEVFVPLHVGVALDLIFSLGFIVIYMPVWMRKVNNFVLRLEKEYSSSKKEG